MSELGQRLKEARLARGLSLDDVQEMTKIRKRYLEAIEAGDYKVLPGSFYVRAFIKTYAETVGVDADELLTEHRKDVPETVQEQTMEPVIQKRRSRQTTERNSKWLSTTLMWSFAVLILVVIYLYFVSGNSNKADKNNETDPTPVTTQAGNKDPKENNNSKGSTGQNGSNSTDNGQTNGTDNTGQNTGNQPDSNNSTDPGSTGSITVSPDGTEGSTTKFKVQSPGNQPVQVVINATGKSWVEVRKGNKSGEKLYYDNTTEGEVLTYDLGPEGLYIKSGASSNTAITVAGQEVKDGKNTSKIQLNLDNGTSNSDASTDLGTNSNTGTNTSSNNSGVTTE
ncbi:cytoskeletal protein RodZ [compost metagenome]